jgi:hypothetical protein
MAAPALSRWQRVGILPRPAIIGVSTDRERKRDVARCKAVGSFYCWAALGYATDQRRWQPAVRNGAHGLAPGGVTCHASPSAFLEMSKLTASCNACGSSRSLFFSSPL